MKNRVFIAAIFAVLVTALPLSAQVQVADWEDIKLFLSVDTVGTFQALSQDNAFNPAGMEYADIDPGFQTAWGNLGVGATIGENEEIEMYFDLYIASRPHPSQMYGHQGYMIFRDMPESLKKFGVLDRLFDHVDVKVGHFLINFGDHLMQRSDNADVQKNPLIGNAVVDPELVAVGGEIYSEPGVFNWMIGVSSGTTTENWLEGRGTGVHGKLWLVPVEDLRISGSYFMVDHSASVGTSAAIFSGNRSGGRYGGIFGNGGAPGEVTPKAGRDVSAYQLDVTWSGSPLRAWFMYGDTKDADTNGAAPENPEEEWAYFAGQLQYFITPELYAAGRWSGARANTLNDASSDGTVDRYQIGLGYWLNKYILGKVEYVHETFRNFNEGDVVNGEVQAWKDPEFSGPVLEVSLSF